uniref:Spondin-1 n=1 Tax=Heligmosomoides polygyrus TaxID=6339 RepID=A0A183FSC8_HELPZ
LSAQFEDDKAAGKFEVVKGVGDARTSPGCRKAGVSHSNLRPKTSVETTWKAPDVSSGCVVFRASVIESKYVWYSEDGQLTKKFCIKGYQKVVPVDDPNVDCCACDQAKYELEFIGLWSKETHPKDFPTLEHLTHFTDMLGASHSKNYSLWKIGDISTDGMKEIAEWGNTFKAEAEAKEKAAEVRTLMKVKGLWYPEVQGRTTSKFVVNKYHHLASLATMFGPSPDWCVGISSVNLCLPDCSWIAERTFDLLPFDAGTDSGPTYMSPNSPLEPRAPIRWITTKDDPLSPFYSTETDVIPPLARLIIRRTEVCRSRQCQANDEYQREAFNITNTSEDEEYKDRRECLMSNWGSWSLCSATCGKGIRMRSRVFVFPIKAQMFNCHRQTTERQFCNAKINECEDSEAFNSKCAVGSWQPWSECSVTCGHGCSSNQGWTLLSGESGDDCSVTPDPLCRTTSWSEWSPCSASCDDGVRVRTRLFFYAEHEQRCSHISLQEKDTCVLQSCRRFIEQNSEEICQEAKEEGQCGGTFPRYWYNHEKKTCERFIYTGCKGNRNQFDTEDECKRVCLEGYEKSYVPNHQLIEEFGIPDVNDGGDAVPCEMNEWTPWGNCSVTCGRGKRTRTRVFPRNGGTPCPEHLTQELRCELRPCPSAQCRVGAWSRWSRCSVACGEGVQVRRRRIQKGRTGDWEEAECAEKEFEERMCRLPCPRT